MSHHWFPDPRDEEDNEHLPGDYGCCHCDVRGDECDSCGDEFNEDGGNPGCAKCMGEGVIPISPDAYLARMV